MLYISLILSAILLLVVNWAHFRKSSPSLTAAVAGVGLGVVPMLAMCFLPLVALQGVLLFLGSLVGVRSKSRARYFLVYSCLVTLFIYAWVGLNAVRNLEALRQRYPLEALAKRLPPRRPLPPPDRCLLRPPAFWPAWRNRLTPNSTGLGGIDRVASGAFMRRRCRPSSTVLGSA